MSRMVFALRAEDTDTAEIEIYDDIGKNPFGGGISAKDVRDRLVASSASTIRLRVNSRGGDVVDGFAMFNALNEVREEGKRVEVDIDSLAASMATVVAMASDEVRIAKNAMFMIHNPFMMATGDADELRKQADMLEHYQNTIADAYVERSNGKLAKAQALKMMEEETWLTADEAEKYGLVDAVKGSSQPEELARAVARVDLASLKLPRAFAAAIDRAKKPPPKRIAAQSENFSIDLKSRERATLAAIGVASVEEAKAAVTLLGKIEHALGAKGDDAHAVALAWSTELPELRARVEELAAQAETNTEAAALDAVIAKGKDQGRLSPAREKTVRDAYASGNVNLKGAETLVASYGVIPGLARTGTPPVTNHANTWNGKTYNDLKPAERAALKRENPELSTAMRKSVGLPA